MAITVKLLLGVAVVMVLGFMLGLKNHSGDLVDNLLARPLPWDRSCTAYGSCPEGGKCTFAGGWHIACDLGFIRDHLPPGSKDWLVGLIPAVIMIAVGSFWS